MGLWKKRKERKRLLHFPWMQLGSLHDQRDGSTVSAEPAEVKKKKRKRRTSKKSQFHVYVCVCRAGFGLVVWSASGAAYNRGKNGSQGRGSCRAKSARRDL